jgi:hypothetical protein
MSDRFDPLETELRALRPHEPSAQLRHRIGTQLDAAPPTWPRRHWRLAALALAGAVAACLAAVIYIHEGDRPTISAPAFATPTAPVANPFDDSLPSVWVYQKALRDSPDALNTLLAKHAAGSLPVEPVDTNSYALLRPDVQMDKVFGEL